MCVCVGGALHVRCCWLGGLCGLQSCLLWQSSLPSWVLGAHIRQNSVSLKALSSEKKQNSSVLPNSLVIQQQKDTQLYINLQSHKSTLITNKRLRPSLFWVCYLLHCQTNKENYFSYCMKKSNWWTGTVWITSQWMPKHTPTSVFSSHNACIS